MGNRKNSKVEKAATLGCAFDEKVDDAITFGIMDIQAEMIESQTEHNATLITQPVSIVEPECVEPDTTLISDAPYELPNVPILTEVYNYAISNENETLIVDKPSEPLTMHEIGNKEHYSQYAGTPFIAYYNGVEIYSNESNSNSIQFEEDCFILHGKKYGYKGLRIKK